MKKYLLLVIALFVLSGCYSKPYIDVKTKSYATVQLVPDSKTLLFKDTYRTFITDYKKMKSKPKCKGDGALGQVATDSDTPSRLVKVPSDKELLFNVEYIIRSGNSTSTEYTKFVLTPQKHKNYVILYQKKNLSLFKSVSDFSILERRGNRLVSVPKSRLKSYSYEKDCR